MAPTLHTLITGASSGIGRAAAVRLSPRRNLILHGRDIGRLEEVRQSCQDPCRHLVWPFDLRNLDELAGALTPLLADAGRAVDAFVHCAGMVTVLPMRSIDHHVAEEVMRVNFFSAVEIINLLLKKKTNTRSLRSVIFISSIWSRFGARGHAAYCASKAALDGLMRALAVELAPEVRVNSILPGAVRTAMASQAFEDAEIAAKLERDYPLGAGRGEDIAGTIEFFLSSDARWLTGQQLVVDGGRTVDMSLK